MNVTYSHVLGQVSLWHPQDVSESPPELYNRPVRRESARAMHISPARHPGQTLSEDTISELYSGEPRSQHLHIPGQRGHQKQESMFAASVYPTGADLLGRTFVQESTPSLYTQLSML